MYAKIFRQIYEGSLCTRGPWQALVTFQQFLILSDRFGVVDMTAEAISRISTIPIDIIKVGITSLEQEDDDSRNPSLNGKRIVRLAAHRDWGWQIVNYQEFAKIRSAEERREYQRKYKQEQRKKQKESTVSIGVNIVNPINPSTHTQLNNPSRASYDALFVGFWNAYPRKKSKGQAWKSWQRLKPDHDLNASILAGLSRAIASSDWKRENGRFIPHPATWLNARGWEDEADQRKASGFASAW